MKLRSGKVLLPPLISKKLNSNLKDLKILLANNKDFAKELVTFIALSPSVENRFEMSDMIRRQFVDVREGLLELIGTSGSLLMLVTCFGFIFKDNNIKYNDFYRNGMHIQIQKDILKAFEIDVKDTLLHKKIKKKHISNNIKSNL
eukprot:TRINITY_DN556_c0_g5_i1.p1 TRINITY_DN556_c0_g5~~TRINITY_DN556_c0_g5_i1.p1  ORF type:complete len:145 (+),score=5.83 TRINITY_DN556_c0_g5_i1:79-513(+)